MNEYSVGQVVTVQGTYKNSSGTPSDPTTVKLTVTFPDESSETYTYGVGAEITKSGTGVYSCDLDTTGKRGFWIYRFWSTGSIQADSGEQEFCVR